MAVSRLPGVRRQFLSGTDILSDELKLVNVSGISVNGTGCQQQAVTFTKPFPHTCDAVFLQIKEFRNASAYIDCPSGLKVMVWPPKRLQTKTGFQLNIDVNVSCKISAANMSVEALALGR